MARIQIYDTTLRDGSQGEGVNFSLADKLAITQRLDELGFDYIEGGFPGSTPKDYEYFQRVQELPLQHARVAAFGMTRRRGVTAAEDQGLQTLAASGAGTITLVGKTWDLHVTEVLRVDEAENLAMIRDSVAYFVNMGREVIYDAEHFFDGFRHNPEFALRTLRAAQDAGATLIALCDTNGGSLPEVVVEALKAAQSTLSIAVGIHCHNDCELAVANSLAAVAAGAVQVQGTINGLGERCGNADLISVVANLAIKQGHSVLMPNGLQHLTELSRYVYELANMNFRTNQPYVGASAFAHKGGMHVHAVNRIAHSYEHISPETVGNARRVLVSELSGRSNIIAKTTKYRIDHDNALMTRILERVVDLENEGYQFEAAEASFDLLVRKVAGSYESWFDKIHYRVNVESESIGCPITEATVKLKVGNEIRHEVGEGDGPVNALDNALRKALTAHYPRLAEMHLIDYKVRVINSSEGTAARVRVIIESRDTQDAWTTVGVSENIIEASWLALVDSVEFKLFKDSGELAVAVSAPAEANA